MWCSIALIILLLLVMAIGMPSAIGSMWPSRTAPRASGRPRRTRTGSAPQRRYPDEDWYLMEHFRRKR